MPDKLNSCLFDLWKSTSAPIFHMSEFWPSFNESKIQEFINGRADEPTAATPLNTPAATAAQHKIEEFLETIHLLPSSDFACKSAYQSFEQERLAGLDLIVRGQNAAHADRANDLLYGKLESIGSTAALSYLADYLNELAPASTAVAEYRAKLQAAWDHTTSDTAIGNQFDSIERYRLALRPFVQEHYGYMEQLLAPYSQQATLDSEETRSVLAAGIIRILGEGGAGWQAVIKDGAPNVFIDHERMAVIIPGGREYSKDHVNSLVVHEVGVHVLRAVNGAASRERLAGYGLPGYGPIEEAFGVLLGNATKTEYRQINSLIPFAVIEFASRSSRPSFRQTYEFTKALIICLSNPTAAKLKLKEAEYSRAAFSRVLRVLRLGTGELIERSTTKYWRGLLMFCRHFDSNGLTEASFNEFFLGKYDANSAQQLGLIVSHSTHDPKFLVP